MAGLFSIAAAAVVAGNNWQRLGKPQRMWSTILLSVTGFVIYVTIITMLSGAEELFWILIVGGSALAGAVLAYLQRPAYASWTCTYGNRSLQEAGCLIPMVVCLGSLIIGLGWFMLGFD